MKKVLYVWACEKVKLKSGCSATETSFDIEFSRISCTCGNCSLFTFQIANNKRAEQTTRLRRLVCAFVVNRDEVRILFEAESTCFSMK